MTGRERAIVAVALGLLSALAWAESVRHAGGMGLGFVTCSMTMGRPFSASGALLYVALWGVMMAAMMLPSVAPMVLTFFAASSRRPGGRAGLASTASFVAGYVALWTLTGVLAYAADLGIESLPRVFPDLRAHAAWIGGATLVVAGAYQLTPLKNLCLDHCRSPFAFLLHGWRDGRLGAFRMGVDHGAYCLACCWSLMTVLFVVGTMNLVWMGVLTLLIFAEKSLRHGPAVAKAAGVALIGLGVAFAGAGA